MSQLLWQITGALYMLLGIGPMGQAF